MKEYIDWTIFLGMHHIDKKIRIRCKNFFVTRLNLSKNIYMSFENIGKCDDIIWTYDQKIQNFYYPFMDLLHSQAIMNRAPYSLEDFEIYQSEIHIHNLSLLDGLSVSMSKNNTLYTYSQDIIQLSLKNIKQPPEAQELFFPKELEELYQKSLSLVLNVKKY
ncbi:hypothetical protein COB57_05340 [Candidatus Peregrinibacteria bacterium]|nr:MAG: hypothetical protein COB57_05340 [Candidatus Peregrinibacteria bacterium]